MKLIDVFPDALTGSGIFEALTAYNVPWKTDISSISLDLEYFGNVSGDKTVSPLIRKLSVNGVLSSSAIAKIAQSLYNMHGLRWTKLWNTYQLEYDPIQNYNMTEIMSDDDTITTYGRTHSKTGTEVDDRTRTDDNKESVYGFNSSTASDSDESDRTINDDNTHTYNVSDTDTGSDRQSHSYELTRSGNIGVTTSQQMIESERALWMWRYFYDVVFPDVDKMLTISVYSDDADIAASGGIAPTGTISITSNGDYDVIEYANAAVNVPNTYSESDNGMVVHDGELVSQIGREISENGTYDTTLNNAVAVSVPNTYTSADEGKVVNNGALVAQGSRTITENGNYDTTLISAVSVNVPSDLIVGSSAPTSDIGDNGDYYKQVFPLSENINYVDYLQSSGTQYINTGIIGNQNTGYIYDQDVNIAAWAFGSRAAAQSAAVVITSDGASTTTNTFDLGTERKTISGLPNRRKMMLKNRDLYINDVLRARYGMPSVFSTPNPLLLFGVYNGYTVALTEGGFKLYRAVIYDGYTPIADYIPCLDNNNVACMWDNIAGEYVYNSGTGVFSYGSSITPEDLDPVLWVKNNNTWSVVG